MKEAESLYNKAIARSEGHFLQGDLSSAAHCTERCEKASDLGFFVVASRVGSEPRPDTIVGLCCFTAPPARGGDAHLSMVSVQEDHCRRGIAGKMIEVAVDRAAAAGAARLGLHIPSPRDDMERYYSARGFTFEFEENMPEQ